MPAPLTRGATTWLRLSALCNDEGATAWLRFLDLCVDGGTVVRKVLLPLSLGAAEPAPMPWGATTWLRLLALCIDGRESVGEIGKHNYPL